MSKKQTAVEWLFERINLFCMFTDGIPDEWSEALEQAKQMEKDQIIEAFWSGDNSDCTAEQNSKEFAEQYYNDNYDQSN